MTIEQELALVVRRYPELRELLEVAQNACAIARLHPLLDIHQKKFRSVEIKIDAILSPPNIAHLRNLPPPTREGDRGPDAGSDSL